MAMPKHSTSFEHVFHEMLAILSSNLARERYEFEQPSEKDANYFRLRFYAFQRTVAKENFKKLETAKTPEAIALYVGKMKQVEQSKRFAIQLRGSTVVAINRDGAASRFASVASQMSKYMEEINQEQNTFATQLPQIQKQARESSDELFMAALNKVGTTAPEEVEDPYVAATAEPKHSQSPAWHATQAQLLLSLGKEDTFERNITDYDEQREFLRLLEALTIIPYTATITAMGVTIHRVAIRG
jgi:hypothetical protein